MLKTILWWIGGGGIALLILAVFMPTLNDATGNTTAQMGNITNMTGMTDMVSMTPLFMWLGFLSLCLVGIVVYLWNRRRSG